MESTVSNADPGAAFYGVDWHHSAEASTLSPPPDDSDMPDDFDARLEAALDRRHGPSGRRTTDQEALPATKPLTVRDWISVLIGVVGLGTFFAGAVGWGYTQQAGLAALRESVERGASSSAAAAAGVQRLELGQGVLDARLDAIADRLQRAEARIDGLEGR